MERFQDLSLLTEITGRKRGRIFSYEPYLDIFREKSILDRAVLFETTAIPSRFAGPTT